MIHISKIADARITHVSDVFEVGEPVKVIMVKSPIPDRLAFRYAAPIFFYISARCFTSNLFIYEQYGDLDLVCCSYNKIFGKYDSSS